MRLEPGNQVDRYTIEAVIGEGGMGRVCRAFDTRLHRRVALKVLHLVDADDATDLVASALREARAAAAIAHPNATAVYDADELDGAPYIVMEFVPGTSLRQIITGPPVSIALRLRWLVDIAGALGAAHQVGIVHRDVKPENVMVRDDGLVKVLDFGVARRTLSGTRTHESSLGEQLSTPDGRLVGTPAYMPPEQIRGEAIDGRADQFAWGVLAYELLTGRLPWKTAREFLGYIAAVLTEKPEPPRTIAPEIPPPVEAAILKALSKNPANRFASLAHAAAELVPFAQDALHAAGNVDRATPPAPAPAPAPRASSPVVVVPADRPSDPRAASSRDPAPTHFSPAREPSSTPIPDRPSTPHEAPPRPLAIPSPPPPSRPASPPPPPRGFGDFGVTVRSGLPHEPLSRVAPAAKPAAPAAPAPAVEPPSSSGSSVPPARPSAPAPTSMPSVRRALPDGYHKLRDPRFDVPVDLEAHLALLPPEATCKGMFFIDLLRMGARAATSADLSRAAQIAERRYLAFHDYSAAENMRLTVAVAKAVYPRHPLGEGLRRLGQSTFDNVLGTHVGRSILGILGPDIEKILLAGPKTLKHLCSFGRVTVEKAGAHTYLFRVKELPVFLETFQVGVLEGALRHCRAQGKVRIALDDLAGGLGEVRVG